MLDEMTWDSDYLALGLRYEGPRKPSEVLEAMRPDLEHVCDRALEGGVDPMKAMRVTMTLRGFILLAKDNPDLDLTLGDEDEEMDADPEFTVLADYVYETMSLMERDLPARTRYGWVTDDPDEPGYDALGVWPDWDAVNEGIEDDTILELDNIDVFVERRQEMRNDGFLFALIYEGEDAILLDTATGEIEWRW